ncbi:MAG TPA: hypothetical protein VLV30_09185 [Methanomicrobiales archaeon]|nr:hypothetical protein [Methanomicrobiales archaeon]
MAPHVRGAVPESRTNFPILFLSVVFLALLALATPAGAAVTITNTTVVNGSYSDNLTQYTGTGSSSWLCPSQVTSVLYLMVAGGGGGGSRSGNGGSGGGGGGGILNGTLAVTGGTRYNVTVGAGGAAGANGKNSTFANITSTDAMHAAGGGHGGAGGAANSGLPGGSGGGGGAINTGAGAGGSGIAGQGQNGGDGNMTSRSGGGGGGYSTAGTTPVNSTTSTGGTGGDGGAFSLAGNPVVYGGGGGGGNYLNATLVLGGAGGGGTGGNSTSTSGGAGTAGLGGGGGGSYSSGGSTGGAGGSGVVWLRYFVPPPIIAWSGTPLNGSVTTVFTFNDTSINGDAYSWNFNDGNTTTVKNTTHRFPCPSGTCIFAINHSVSNFQGTAWLNRSNYITIYNNPIVSFTANRTGNLGVGPQPVMFNDTSLNNPATWGWNMTELNGTRVQFSTSQNITQVFSGGNWSVTLTIGNPLGSNVSAAKWENVTAATVSIALNQTSPIYLALNYSASPATNSSLGLLVSSNVNFAVTVQDTTGRTSGDQGYMGNYTASTLYQSSPINTKLGSALGLSGTTNGTTVAAAIAPPITATPQTLYTGQPKTNQPLVTLFSQPVTFGDSVLPAGSAYRIDLQFTITST